MNNLEYILPENIKEILSRYYDGLTSLDEEKLLKKYFKEHQIPESLLTDQAIFSFTRSDEINLFPEHEIWDKIKQKESKQHKFRIVIGVVSSIAASLVILISIGTWYHFSSEKHNSLAVDTYSNPEDAYKAVEKYLGFASSKLSYAYTEIKPIEKLSIPSKAIQPFEDIDKNLNRLNQLDRINSTTKKLQQLTIITEIMKVDNN